MRAQSRTLISLYMHGMAGGQTGPQYCSGHKVRFAQHRAVRLTCCCAVFMRAICQQQVVAGFMSVQMHTVPDAQKRGIAGISPLTQWYIMSTCNGSLRMQSVTLAITADVYSGDPVLVIPQLEDGQSSSCDNASEVAAGVLRSHPAHFGRVTANLRLTSIA